MGPPFAVDSGRTRDILSYQDRIAMLLTAEQKEERVNQLIEKARDLLRRGGVVEEDTVTGLTVTTLRTESFVVIDHQRQQLKGGEIKTNGLDIWYIKDGGARKGLSVCYLPFRIKSFDHVGMAHWIEQFLAI
jgi:hypothetical protein